MGDPHLKIIPSYRSLSFGRVSGKLKEKSKRFLLHPSQLGMEITSQGRYVCFPYPEITARVPTIDLLRELYSRLRSKKTFQEMQVLLDIIETENGQSEFLSFYKDFLERWKIR